jgi:hypothetical protein
MSLGTLKRYSTAYGWQSRIAEARSAAVTAKKQEAINAILAMQDRHSQLGRAMQGAGGAALQRLLSNDTRLAGLKPAEMARLIDLGLKAERSALGAATDRREIGLEIWNDVVVSVVALFERANGESEARVRARLFARGLDDLVTERLEGLE